MKLQKVLDKTVNGKRYYRYRLCLPKYIVEESNFYGKKLTAIYEKNSIIITEE